MDLKVNKNGKVAFILKSGKDQVKGEMLDGEAKDLIRKGVVTQEKGKIIVDDKFIFTLADAEEETVEPKKEEQKEEPKKEDDVPLSEVAKKKPAKKKLTDNADKEPLSKKPLARKKKK